MPDFTEDVRYQIQSIFDGYTSIVFDAIAEWVQWAADYILEKLDATWPDAGEIHPYATGRSRGEWHGIIVDAFSAIVGNAASRKGRVYVGYTEEGYTTKGPYTAKSFGDRGMSSGEGYARKVIESEREYVIAELQRRIDAAVEAHNGRL